MNVKTRKIEIDEAMALALESRAAERGVSVSEVLADLMPVKAARDEIAELDRRWKAVESGQATTRNEDVVTWLKTWGIPAFKAWRGR